MLELFIVSLTFQSGAFLYPYRRLDLSCFPSALLGSLFPCCRYEALAGFPPENRIPATSHVIDD